jgi:tRNA A37 methylthiotransferase MiaB
MARRYTASDVRRVFDVFRQSLPDAQFSTDFIIGFPQESDEDFEQSRILLRDIDPDFLSAYKYEERPGTAAARETEMVPEHERIARTTRLIEDFALRQLHKQGLDSVDGLARYASRNRRFPVNTNLNFGGVS